jgi:hypothetical protein
VCKDETKKYSRLHGAWCVGLIAGGNYVAAGSQRVAQGGIEMKFLMFLFESLLVALSLEFSIRALPSLES